MTEYLHAQDPRAQVGSATPLKKRIPRLVAVLVLLLVILWVGRIALAGLSLRRHLSEAQGLAAGSSKLDPAAACTLVRALRGDVVTLRNFGGPLVALAPAFGWLPQIGGDLAAAPQLLAVGDGLTEAGALACSALEPAFAPGNGAGVAGTPLARMLAQVAAHGPAFGQAQAAAERAQAAWARVDVSRLSPGVASKASLLGRGLPLLRTGLAGAALAPQLLGFDRPRTYLVLALNEDELRPGGGFISGAGEVQISAGQVVTMTFRDSYRADDYHQPYDDPPDPLRRYMGLDLWVFRDSNWSADFPTAARQAIATYRPGYPVSLDGVIAINQQAVKTLVGAVGPLTIAGEAQPVTGANVLSYVRHAWGPENGQLTGSWWKNRKSFMGPLAQAAWGRVQAGEADWTALGTALLPLLDGKHLMAYLNDPAGQALLAAQGWDGGLRAGSGDYIMVADANVGYNKVNARIKASAAYAVDLRSSPAQGVLTLTHRHTGQTPAACKPESRYDPTYEQMMDRCYWDYLQVYVPAESRLVDATRIPVPAAEVFAGTAESGDLSVSRAPEGPWQALGVLSVIPPGAAETRAYTLTLPTTAVQWRGEEGTYSLRVQKQPGTPSSPFALRVRLPAEAALLSSSPTPGGTDGDWLVYNLTLGRDQDVTIRFRSKR